MKRDYFDNIGPVYKFWCSVAIFLESILPFNLARKCIKKNIKDFSEKWVVIHTILSVLAAVVTSQMDSVVISKILVIYAMVRIFEIIIYQINVLIFHPYRAMVLEGADEYILQNPYRSVVLLGHNLVEIIFWFTAVLGYIQTIRIPLIQALMENTIRIFTFNYERIPGQPTELQYVIFAEVLCGVILVIISLAKFIGELPHVNLKFEDQGEISQNNKE